MSIALSISDNTSSWQLWSLGAEDVGYTATGAGVPIARGSTQPRLLGVGLLATLVGTAVAGPTAYDLLVGTGGTAGYLSEREQWDATTLASPGNLLAEIGERSAADATTIIAGADLVAEIKSTLGVSVTDLAAIARVSRQSIYDWIGEGQVSEANYERLLALRRVCLDWQSRMKRPVGRLLHAKTADGRSLLDLLAEEPLDRSAIRLHLDALAATAVKQAEERQERNARLAPLSEKDQYENALTHAIPAADS